MTIYDIATSIRYDYDPPATAGRNILRLLPAHLPGRQRLILSQVSASPNPAERSERNDFFGNRLVEMSFRNPAASTEFTLRARVERLRAAAVGGPDQSAPLGDIGMLVGHDQSLAPDAPQHFIGPSPRVSASAEIADFARAATLPGTTVRHAVGAIGRALHQAMTFDPDATTVDTSPDEAFRLRRGVCQDLAHVMIAALRGMGVPAGYVSGYLRTTPPVGHPRLEGADAMHAWVRAWSGPATGWVEYDPTNAVEVGADHVIVAYGRDYDDVAPVQGVLRTSGWQRSVQTVDTRLVDGQD